MRGVGRGIERGEGWGGGGGSRKGGILQEEVDEGG